MKKNFRRLFITLLALVIVAAIPVSAAWAKYVQDITVTDTLRLVIGTKHTLTLNANGGSFADSATTSTKELLCGQKYGEMPAPTRTNCTFKGWFEKQEQTYDEIIQISEDSVMGDADSTIYAHWTGTWNVKINSNGGTLYVKDSTIIQGASVENPKQCNEATFKVIYNDGAYNNLLIEAKKEGYQCTGYFDASDGGIQVWEASGPCIKDSTYYKNNGGPRGALWINTTHPQSEVFVFYPQWKANTYQIQYNSNVPEGEVVSGTMENTVCTYDQNVTLPENVFLRTGYTFVGWAKAPDADSPDYKDKEEVRNLTTENNGTVTLYAVWTAEESNDDPT